ncbi:hypothetical protein D3C81_1877930 [compost metagenome]
MDMPEKTSIDGCARADFSAASFSGSIPAPLSPIVIRISPASREADTPIRSRWWSLLPNACTMVFSRIGCSTNRIMEQSISSGWTSNCVCSDSSNRSC